jgi:hypothetical protein
MTATKLEKAIRHKRMRKGSLVPLLEDMFQAGQVEIESPQDIEFIVNILESQLARSLDRNNRPVFSPSQLSTCLRHVYLLKHHKSLKISRLASVRVEPNFYFFNGNWLHLKWQFALYKLDQFINDPTIFKLIGVEIPIFSKRKDHGGTADALIVLHQESVLVDFKGLNVRAFGEITRGYIPVQYMLQLADYGMLFNSVATRHGGMKIERGLLITENKGGPLPKLPLALQETEVEISTHLPEVRSRLEVLREHGEANTIPPPECDKTTSLQFQACPFRKFCREEVRQIERQNRELESEDAKRLRVEAPSRSRNHRARGNSKR